MTKKPKVGDLLRFDEHSYCIVTRQVQNYDGHWNWDIHWIMAIDPQWYRDEYSTDRYSMEHFSFDNWVNLSA